MFLEPDCIRMSQKARKINRRASVGVSGWHSGFNMEEGELVKIHSLGKPLLGWQWAKHLTSWRCRGNKELSQQTWKESGREETSENKILFVPLPNMKHSQLMTSEKNINIFLGLVPGKKEVVRNTESFSPTVHANVCSAGMSRDRLHGQITHEYQKQGGGSQKGMAQNIPLAWKEAEYQHRSSESFCPYLKVCFFFLFLF